MTNVNDRELISVCGLFCGGCPLFLAQNDESLRLKIARAKGVGESEIKTCSGCRSLQGRMPEIGEDVCSTYRCASARKIEFCYMCNDFPCSKLAPCADRAKDIPHNTKIYNLLLLQKEGYESFTRNYRDRIRRYLSGKKPRAGADIEI